VYIGARSQARAEEAISKLKELTGKEALFLKLDLGDLKAVKAAAEEFLRYASSLLILAMHLIFNTAKKRSCMYCLTMGTSQF
jgi:NADP-dependent 3-hydroxy acid dehydrogenase YdfG